MKKPSQPAEEPPKGWSGWTSCWSTRSRLGACVLLADVDAMTFTSLRQLLQETDGNLGAHLRKLEDAGYLDVDKRFENRKPVTWYRLTEKGSKALQSHLEALQTVIRGARL